jgi:hypothetical protein
MGHSDIGPIIAAIVAVLAAVQNQRKKARAATPPVASPPAVQESDESERTQRVQEEIRRKIERRRRNELKPIDPFGGPREMRRLTSMLTRPEPVAPMETAAPRRSNGADATANLAKPMVAAPPASLAGSPSIFLGTPEISPSVGAGLLTDLRSPGSVRRAMVLREILGPPVGLR